MTAAQAKKLAEQNKPALDVDKIMASIHGQIEVEAKKGKTHLCFNFGFWKITVEQTAAILKKLKADGYSVEVDRKGNRTIKW